MKPSTRQKSIKTRAKVRRFSNRPRLVVFRSSKHIYAQIIDPKTAKVLAQASDVKITDKMTKSEKAALVGADIAKLAIKAKIKTVAFDRGAYKYHGRVKALCEAARENKLTI
jgi:large subunit ribosomal protein L18